MTNTETGQGKGRRAVRCLLVDQLAGWLFGVETARVKPELREKMTRYRRECYRVLARAFEADLVEAVATQPCTDAIAALEQVRQIGIALTRRAEQQIELEHKQTTDQRLDRGAAVVGDIQKRLAVVEKRTAPQEVITDEQAEEVAGVER